MRPLLSCCALILTYVWLLLPRNRPSFEEIEQDLLLELQNLGVDLPLEGTMAQKVRDRAKVLHESRRSVGLQSLSTSPRKKMEGIAMGSNKGKEKEKLEEMEIEKEIEKERENDGTDGEKDGQPKPKDKEQSKEKGAIEGSWPENTRAVAKIIDGFPLTSRVFSLAKIYRPAAAAQDQAEVCT